MSDPNSLPGIVGEAPRPTSPRAAVLAISGMATALLLAVLTFVPLPYTIDRAGPTFDVLASHDGTTLLNLTGVTTYPATGQLRVTTVAVSSGSHGHLPFGAVLGAWLSPDSAVFPENSEGGGSVQEEWVSSQEMAEVAALAHQGVDVPALISVAGIEPSSHAANFLEKGDEIVSINGTAITTYPDLDLAMGAVKVGDFVTVTVRRAGNELTETFPTQDDGHGRPVMGIWVDPQFTFPFTLNIGIDNVGGPSGGAMFALAIIDLLTPEDELHGQKVAGTGTIDIAGSIGPIGGIALKMIGASDAGAQWFLAPASNCPEVRGHVPGGLKVIAVATLDEAYDAMVAIGAGDASSLPTCG